MRPHQSSHSDPQGDLFKVELEAIFDPNHPLVCLAGKLGDKLNAVRCACGHNLRLILGKLRQKEG